MAYGAVTADTGVLVLTVTGRHVRAAKWVPGTIVNGQPQPATGALAEGKQAHWSALRSCTDLTAAPK